MNNYTIEDVYGYKEYEFLNELLDRTLSILSLENIIFCVILIDDEQMKKMNREYRNIDKTTDVLSFAFQDTKDVASDILVLGDIYISIPQMKRQAKDYNTGEKRELSFLAIHGLLHLLGYNHEDANDEKIMFDLQERILDGKV